MSTFPRSTYALLATCALTLSSCSLFSSVPTMEEQKADFLKECEQKLGQAEYCSCTWEQIDAELDAAEFVDFAKRLENEEPDALVQMTTFSAACVSHLDPQATTPVEPASGRTTAKGYAIPATSDWPEGQVEAFISRCEAASNGATAMCECKATAAQEHSIQEMLDILNDEALTKEFTEKLNTACPSQ